MFPSVKYSSQFSKVWWFPNGFSFFLLKSVVSATFKWILHICTDPNGCHDLCSFLKMLNATVAMQSTYMSWHAWLGFCENDCHKENVFIDLSISHSGWCNDNAERVKINMNCASDKNKRHKISGASPVTISMRVVCHIRRTPRGMPLICGDYI